MCKYSLVKPIHKSGPKDTTENYRAVCTQLQIPKIFIALITKLSWLCRSILINEHGFVKGKSAVANGIYGLYHNVF